MLWMADPAASTERWRDAVGMLDKRAKKAFTSKVHFMGISSFFKTLEKGTFSWIGWKAILGFSPGHTARVFAPLDTALEGQAREGGETKQGDTAYGRGREEVFVFLFFHERMGGLGWCLATVFSWAKFFFYCIFPFWKPGKSKNKVQLVF